jgi:hypothetical protein
MPHQIFLIPSKVIFTKYYIALIPIDYYLMALLKFTSQLHDY